MSQLEIKRVLSPSKDKLEILLALIAHIGAQNGIIFCNYKDSIQRVSDYLTDNKISHGTFYGGMEQIDRERALIKFRNGTHQILLATDLAARGIDVPEIKFIIHYHLPFKHEEFVHRNGRTARMKSDGTAYVLQYEKESLPDFIGDIPVRNFASCSTSIIFIVDYIVYFWWEKKIRSQKVILLAYFLKKVVFPKRI